MSTTTNALSSQLQQLGLTNTAKSSTPAAAQAANSLNQQDFLQLMIAQFKNQDPFKPMDNGQFLGQMAQFATVSGIGGLQTTMKDLSSSLVSNQTLQATSLIGKNVLAPADTATYHGGTLDGAVKLPTGVHDALVQIRDASGALVARIPVHGQGLTNFQWDGTTTDGSTAPSGNYSLSAGYVSGNSTYDAKVMVSGKVDSVVLNDQTGAKVNVDTLGSISLADVQQIQ